MYKDNAVANVVAEMGRDLVFLTTARLSDLSMPLKGDDARRFPEQSARQPIAKIGKYARGVYSRRTLVVKRRRSFAFSHHGAHCCFVRGLGKRGDLTWQPAVNTKDQL